MRRPALIGAVALVAAAAVVAAGYRVANRTPPQPVMVAVEAGWSAARIAEELERVGVVDSAAAFRLYMRLRGGGGRLQAGEYRLRERMAYREVLRVLRRGPEVEYQRVTVPEGLTLEQTAERVASSTHLTAEDFISAATGETIRPEILPEGVASLEGFLYPETYFVTEKETAEDLVRRMVRQFTGATAEVPWAAAQALGRTPYEILIIASLIEEETKLDEERPTVSAVIYNRLERGMKLEIDATVRYAVSRYDGRPLTQEEIDFDSPYNTRLHPGLPPGPIASPRAASILAALAPADTDVLFFVLTPDCRRHLFTADYEEFLRAKAQQPRC